MTYFFDQLLYSQNNYLFLGEYSNKTFITIHASDNVEDQIFYEDDVNSERHLSIKQRYYVSNRGPSFLHLTYVNISIPVMKHGVQIAVIKVRNRVII